jgi:hypothetical protein
MFYPIGYTSGVLIPENGTLTLQSHQEMQN